jgi:hypothetical protein
MVDFSRDSLIARHGAETATAISFTGRAKNEDRRVHEVELW